MTAVPGRQGPDDDQLGELGPIDMLLGQGDAGPREALRATFDRDPAAMLELADTVALVQRCRELRTEPGDRFACKLAFVLQRAERRAVPLPSRWRGPWLGLLAASVTLALLHAFNPLGPWRRAQGDQIVVATPPPVPSQPVPGGIVPDARTVAWQSAVDQMRRRLDMEATPHLRSALEQGLLPRNDDLGRWLDPRNALVLLRLDHELRANAAVRAAALRAQGGLVAVDDRVQQLADAIAADLATGLSIAPYDESAGTARLDRVAEVAMAVRAMIAAGPGDATRARALHAAGDWLVAGLDGCHGQLLVAALAALVEFTAVTGSHRDAVVAQGERLLASALDPDEETWSRRLPDLLGPHMPPHSVGEAGRLLARLPGFGVDGQRCHLLRELLLGQLRERRRTGENTADLVAALLYGSADLLADDERANLEVQARRWKPIRLAPDFVTVQQLVWSFEPGRSGFATMHRELRQLAVCAEPADQLARAALCLCLATDYAAFGPGVLPKLAAGI